MNVVRAAVVGLIFLEASFGSGQQITFGTQPFSWHADMRTDSAVLEDNAASRVLSDFHSDIQAAKTPASPSLLPPRVADSKFFLFNGVQLGMALFDVEMTQRCIASHHCRETNPLMPSSQVGQISVNIALAAYSSGVSYWLKKHKCKLWWVPPATGFVAHSIGVATGFEHQ